MVHRARSKGQSVSASTQKRQRATAQIPHEFYMWRTASKPEGSVKFVDSSGGLWPWWLPVKG
eukprot:2719949-Prymnesium_polylepis.1